MKSSEESTPSGVRYLREEQRWRRRIMERTWWAVLATGIAVVFMLLAANVPSGDDILKGAATGIMGYLVGAKSENKQNKKINEE